MKKPKTEKPPFDIKAKEIGLAIAVGEFFFQLIYGRKDKQNF